MTTHATPVAWFLEPDPGGTTNIIPTDSPLNVAVPDEMHPGTQHHDGEQDGQG